MREHVAVRMSGETARMVDANAAEHERDAVCEGVCIEARTDPELAHDSTSASSASEWMTVVPAGDSMSA